MSILASPSPSLADQQASRDQVFDAYRRWGYLQAQLDPLGQYLAPENVAELAFDGPDGEAARAIYAGSIGAEFMHIPNSEVRAWVQEQMEAPAPAHDTHRVLELLTKADVFESVIQSRYLGTKRFSLEGVTALIPMLDQIFQDAAARDVVQSVIAMSHRGRLNVMVNTIGRPATDVFAEFEDVDPRSVLGGGDVKYHLGATGAFEDPKSGKTINLHLVSNPSHLEAVDPVAMGRARAKQVRLGPDGQDRLLPIVIHGDSAFAGQGIFAETLNLATVSGYSVGGTIQIIVNNLIGFTAEPEESGSTKFSSDVAKRLPIPIFHVNAEDLDSVIKVARVASEFRAKFHNDVVIDLIGYRRHGHSEVDDPTITQPLRYARIAKHPPLYKLYAEQIGAKTEDIAQQYQSQLFEAQKTATGLEKMPAMATRMPYWSKFRGGAFKPEYEVQSGLPAQEIGNISTAISSYPEGFHVHPKIKKLLEQRIEMGQGKRPFDYGMAELVAFGSLLKAGVPVRLSGQDSQRGTFNQRHSVLVDIENESHYFPLNHIGGEQAKYEVYNSTLSEAGVLGFEFGYSRDYPESLVLWEAQFGDFANGAQIIIDQFISATEDKWNLLSGVVMLLPHGYEGQGPEHSSARVERYLQLAARDNMVIAQPSTAAQYFHLLRRQALRPWRKPMVVFTPKAMLRHPDAVSNLAEFTRDRFLNVVPETEVENAKRLLVCTGKIGHELRMERKAKRDDNTGVIFLDQLYPFPEVELRAAIEAHPEAQQVIWVQEEPANMGAVFFVMPRLRRVAGNRQVLSIKRSESASPATGSRKAHEMEQKTILELALSPRGLDHSVEVKQS